MLTFRPLKLRHQVGDILLECLLLEAADSYKMEVLIHKLAKLKMMPEILDFENRRNTFFKNRVIWFRIIKTSKREVLGNVSVRP